MQVVKNNIVTVIINFRVFAWLSLIESNYYTIKNNCSKYCWFLYYIDCKLLVKKKSSPKKFDKFVDKLYASDVAELKIVENFQEEIDHDDIDS